MKRFFYLLTITCLITISGCTFFKKQSEPVHLDPVVDDIEKLVDKTSTLPEGDFNEAKKDKEAQKEL
jgi:hypothetical protein